jgi:hypothetical protein
MAFNQVKRKAIACIFSARENTRESRMARKSRAVRIASKKKKKKKRKKK